MSPSSNNKNSPAVLAAVSAASVLVTYVTLSLLQSRREEKARAAAFEERQAAKRKQKEKQIAAGDPDGILLEAVKLERVYLWDVEKLSSRFPAEGGGKVVNRMQFGSKQVKEESDLFAALKRSTLAISEEESVCCWISEPTYDVVWATGIERIPTPIFPSFRSLWNRSCLSAPILEFAEIVDPSET